MAEEGARAIHIQVSGRVQGVAYRAWTERRANELGLSGWVRNLANGDVEAMIAGPPDRLVEMLLACRRGPRLAEVERLDVLGPGQAAEGPFTIRYDR